MVAMQTAERLLCRTNRARATQSPELSETLRLEKNRNKGLRKRRRSHLPVPVLHACRRLGTGGCSRECDQGT